MCPLYLPSQQAHERKATRALATPSTSTATAAGSSTSPYPVHHRVRAHDEPPSAIKEATEVRHGAAAGGGGSSSSSRSKPVVLIGVPAAAPQTPEERYEAAMRRLAIAVELSSGSDDARSGRPTADVGQELSIRECFPRLPRVTERRSPLTHVMSDHPFTDTYGDSAAPFPYCKQRRLLGEK